MSRNNSRWQLARNERNLWLSINAEKDKTNNISEYLTKCATSFTFPTARIKPREWATVITTSISSRSTSAASSQLQRLIIATAPCNIVYYNTEELSSVIQFCLEAKAFNALAVVLSANSCSNLSQNLLKVLVNQLLENLNCSCIYYLYSNTISSTTTEQSEDVLQEYQVLIFNSLVSFLRSSKGNDDDDSMALNAIGAIIKNLKTSVVSSSDILRVIRSRINNFSQSENQTAAAALKLLGTVASVIPSSITSSITLYLPTNKDSLLLFNDTPSILSIILLSKFTEEALRTLQSLVEILPIKSWFGNYCVNNSSNSFVVLPTTSFVPMSVTAVEILECIYKTLSASVMNVITKKKRTDQSLLIILKIVAMLLARIPMSVVLTSSVASSLEIILRQCQVFLASTTNHSVRLASASVLNNFFSTCKRHEDFVTKILSTVNADANDSTLFSDIINYAVKQKCDEAIRLEALGILQKNISNNGAYISSKFSAVSEVMRLGFSDSEASVRLASLKLLQAYVESSNSTSKLLQQVVLAFNDPSVHVRAAACNVFSSTSCWNDFSSKTFLDVLKLSTSPIVLAAALRMVGLASYDDVTFVTSVVKECVKVLNKGDTTLNVRVRAAVALGNTIVKSSIDVEVQHDVYQTCVRCLDDNEKVVSNVIRTLGYVGKSDLVLKLLGKKLCEKNVGPKVRWNLCHTISKILLRQENTYAVPTVVVNALAEAILDDSNFKVRIAASDAVRSTSCSSTLFEAVTIALRDNEKSYTGCSSSYQEQLRCSLVKSLFHLKTKSSKDFDTELVALLEQIKKSNNCDLNWEELKF